MQPSDFMVNVFRFHSEEGHLELSVLKRNLFLLATVLAGLEEFYLFLPLTANRFKKQWSHEIRISSMNLVLYKENPETWCWLPETLISNKGIPPSNDNQIDHLAGDT